MQVPVYSLNGEIVDQIELSQAIFALPFNGAVVHQAMTRQLANKRQGTASTKTKSPLLRGGGIVFGPKPRTYRQSMPKKMRQLALKCLLSAKVREGNIKLVQELDFEEPKTKDMIDVLSSLGIGSSTLILTAQSTPNVIKSAA